MSVIDIQKLTCDYGGGRGVFDLSFSVEEGEVFGFLGPNGAGKTTAIRHLMGFSKPRRGDCLIGGLKCWESAAEIQKSLGYIAGETVFFDDMTGLSFLRFLADYRCMRGLGRAEELMERFDLDGKGKLRRMSKGMKQKIAIVAAFMHDPGVLVLDEPTGGLDPLMQSRFIDLVLEEKGRGKTILMSSHMFDEVERTCSRVAIIRQGRLAAVETVEKLKAAQRRNYLVTLADSAEADAFATEGLAITEQDGCRLTVSVQNDLGPFLQILARYHVAALSSVDQSLEDAFMHFYGGEAQ